MDQSCRQNSFFNYITFDIRYFCHILSLRITMSKFFQYFTLPAIESATEILK